MKGKVGYYQRPGSAINEKSDNQTSAQEPITAEQLSKHYKVSRDTVFTDAKASKVIDALGSVSPEAKAKILSGDVTIDKKELQKLASATDDEIKEVAAKMADGTYKKREFEKADDVPAADDSGSAPAHDEAPAVSARLSADVDNAYRVFAGVAKSSTTAKTRKALRALIDALEAIYAI